MHTGVLVMRLMSAGPPKASCEGIAEGIPYNQKQEGLLGKLDIAVAWRDRAVQGHFSQCQAMPFTSAQAVAASQPKAS